MELFENLDNLILIENNLRHIQNELTNVEPSFFRIARESHQVLYRSMVDALKGSANLSITGRPKDKKRSVIYKFGNNPSQEIHKISVNKCQFAWRYSEPGICGEPPINRQSFEKPKIENYLISFYDLLAKIQTECFMHKYVMSKSISVSNNEMKLLEWLHEAVRNEYEHFIPKLYSVFILDLIQTSLLTLKLSQRLLFDSGNVIGINKPENHKKIFIKINHDLKMKEDFYLCLIKDQKKC